MVKESTKNVAYSSKKTSSKPPKPFNPLKSKEKREKTSSTTAPLKKDATKHSASDDDDNADDFNIDDLFAMKKSKKVAEIEVRKKEAKVQVMKAEEKKMKSKLTGDRNDVDHLLAGIWVDDGLGGVFNRDGFTGRSDDDGMKVFKAHLFNQKDFGKTKDCPFDCKCCFI